MTVRDDSIENELLSMRLSDVGAEVFRFDQAQAAARERLIDGAPELLEAATRLVYANDAATRWGQITERLEALRGVIAKIIGTAP